GEVVTLLGPNGAGKTSTVEVLEGYRRADGGLVRVLGLDPRADHDALSARMGVMLQRGGVYPGMSPIEALRLFAAYYDRPEDPDELLVRVGLTEAERTPWRRLSGGQQQRLSLALALVGRPSVAFLDEPTAGVDPEGRLTIRRVVADLRSAGAAVLLTTHELEEAERLADRVVIIDHGRVVAAGTLAELRAQGAPVGAIRFRAEAGLDLDGPSGLAHAIGVPVDEDPPGHYRLEVGADSRLAAVAALTTWLAAAGVSLDELDVGGERLEDVYLRLTGAGASGERRLDRPSRRWARRR
ncbi:MAG: ABC transporter ATP-binding protein, partial [Acidimicrobiaceae bacterium]|nr:ABC transporter ATP-binding protein [Acidimicrobiaceae bacterium]